MTLGGSTLACSRNLLGLLLVVPGGQMGIKQLALQQVQWRFVVKHDVVERVGQDFGRPNQPGLDVLEEEKLDRAKQHAAGADDKPDLRHVPHQLGAVSVRREDAEISRVKSERKR